VRPEACDDEKQSNVHCDRIKVQESKGAGSGLFRTKSLGVSRLAAVHRKPRRFTGCGLGRFGNYLPLP